MNDEALLVLPRDGSFLIVSPASGVCAEHAELEEAYRLVRTRTDGTPPAPAAASTSLRTLMPFFIKAVTCALVGAFLLITAAVAFNYALKEPVRHMGQKAARATISTFEKGFAEKLQKMSPEKQEKIRLALREAVPFLKPYVDELKPLFE